MEDDFRKTITQAMSSVLVVATIVFAYIQIRDNHAATEEQLTATRRNTDIQVMASQFAKGFDLIGSKEIPQRIGGIRVLDEWVRRPLADDGSDLRSRYELVAPALISLIRQYTSFPRSASICEEFKRPDSARIGDDVRAALNVLKPWTHYPRKDILRLDTLNLSGADLTEFDLNATDLSYTDLSGANLTRATFNGSRMYCTNLWASDLSEANFSSSNMTTVLSGSLLMRVTANKTNFKGVNMRSANISEASITESDMSGADLFNANFSRANLYNAKFSRDTDITDACFVETTISETPLKDSRGFESILVVAPNTKAVPRESHCFLPQRNGIMIPSGTLNMGPVK